MSAYERANRIERLVRQASHEIKNVRVTLWYRGHVHISINPISNEALCAIHALLANHAVALMLCSTEIVEDLSAEQAGPPKYIGECPCGIAASECTYHAA
jgi:hypothetical protein